LELQEGLWRSKSVPQVSYPEGGNNVCLQIEEGSYWFQHRNSCICKAVLGFPPGGTFYDIGGGNGFVALALQKKGMDVVLVEPGPGAKAAAGRGIGKVVAATFEGAGFARHSLNSAGAFDVIEHIRDDRAFLSSIRESLVPGGRFYCTVPACPMLWSGHDATAGHFRRYSRRTLTAALEAAGFEIEFLTGFFSWLVLPILAFRVLPFRMGLGRRTVTGSVESVRADHRLPPGMAGLAGRIQAWEIGRLARRKPIPVGASLLCVARARTVETSHGRRTERETI
jgi:SAM-dependent methyltransferase